MFLTCDCEKDAQYPPEGLLGQKKTNCICEPEENNLPEYLLTNTITSSGIKHYPPMCIQHYALG